MLICRVASTLRNIFLQTRGQKFWGFLIETFGGCEQKFVVDAVVDRQAGRDCSDCGETVVLGSHGHADTWADAHANTDGDDYIFISNADNQLFF